MTKSVRLSIYLVTSVIILVYSYLLTQATNSASKWILLFPPGVFTGLIILVRPLWGIYMVLLFSPLQSLGEEVLLLTRLLGIWVVMATFARVLLVQKERVRWAGVEGPVLLMALGMSLSFFRTSNLGLVAMSILSLLSLYGLLLIVFTLVQNRVQLENILFFFLVSGIYPIVRGIIEGMQPHPELTFARVSGTFLLPTGLGAFLIPIVLFAITFAFSPGLSPLKRGFVLALFGSGVVALILTLSRGSIFGVLVGGAVVFMALRPHYGSRKLTVGFILSMGIAAAWVFWPSVHGRVVSPVVEFFTVGASDLNVAVRWNEMGLIIPIVLNTHLLGTGIGNYADAALRYRALFDTPGLPSVPHNIFLYFFGVVGIFGATGFIWLLVHLAGRAASSHRLMMDSAPDLEFYAYVGSIGSLIGFLSFVITHNDFFQNEIWIVMALFIVSIRLAGKKTEQAKPEPLTP